MQLIAVRNIFILLFVACFFFFSQLQTLFISLAFFLTFFTKEFKDFKNSVLKNPLSLSFLLFFLFGFVSLLWTQNMEAGWKGIEIKFSFLAFALFLPVIFNQNIKRSQIINVLTISAVLYIFSSFGRAIYLYAQLGDVSNFYSSNLGFRMFQEGPFVHPTYVSFYYLTLMLIWGNDLIKGGKKLVISSPVGKVILLVLFLLFLFFLASKAGLLGLGVVVILLLVSYAKQEKKIIQALLFFGLMSIVTVVGIYNTHLKAKLSQAYTEFTNPDLKPDSNLKSTGARIWIWKASAQLIKENTLLGVGIGDTKDELSSKYKQMNIKSLEGTNLDSHQQFLQTFLTLGVPGILLLISIFSVLFYRSYQLRHFVLFGFALLYFIFGFTESMLETQAGLLFFVFFVFLFHTRNPELTS